MNGDIFTNLITYNRNVSKNIKQHNDINKKNIENTGNILNKLEENTAEDITSIYTDIQDINNSILHTSLNTFSNKEKLSDIQPLPGPLITKSNLNKGEITNLKDTKLRNIINNDEMIKMTRLSNNIVLNIPKLLTLASGNPIIIMPKAALYTTDLSGNIIIDKQFITYIYSHTTTYASTITKIGTNLMFVKLNISFNTSEYVESDRARFCINFPGYTDFDKNSNTNPYPIDIYSNVYYNYPEPTRTQYRDKWMLYRNIICLTPESENYNTFGYTTPANSVGGYRRMTGNFLVHLK